jgi:hypothetical protein
MGVLSRVLHARILGPVQETNCTRLALQLLKPSIWHYEALLLSVNAKGISESSYCCLQAAIARFREHHSAPVFIFAGDYCGGWALPLLLAGTKSYADPSSILSPHV